MKKLIFIFGIFLVSCTSIDEAVREDTYYIGMEKRIFCNNFHTLVLQDPCWHSLNYDSKTRTQIVAPDDRSFYFVLENVSPDPEYRCNLCPGTLAYIADSYGEAKRFIASGKTVGAFRNAERIQKVALAEEQKQRLLAQFINRCTEYGFTGENNIAACVQREVQHDRDLEQQKYELLQAQNKASEEVTFLQMVLEGIADVDWVTQVQLANKQKQINALKKRPPR